MKAMVYAAGLMAAIVATPSLATDLTTFNQKISYSIGYKVGKSLKAGEGELKLDLDVVKEAITDVMTDTPLKMTDDEMKAAFMELQKQRRAAMEKKK
jgi:FKBP-type peptidyl-prolyl cis-trans isomerase